MKTFKYYAPKVIKKFFASIFSLVLRLFSFVYRVGSFFVSLACIGIVAMGLIAAIAQFVSVGATREAFIYLAVAVAGYALRCIVLGILPILLKLQAIVDAKARAPIHEGAYYYDDYYDNYGVYDDYDCYDGYYYGGSFGYN